MPAPNRCLMFAVSPSLRGSGLKLMLLHVLDVFWCVSLFTREWIEIDALHVLDVILMRLPLYEGVDWNCFDLPLRAVGRGLPLYEGVDWNQSVLGTRRLKRSVSLFTREWIEMAELSIKLRLDGGLPLYEGVDWNNCVYHNQLPFSRLPLYEGVDWNSKNHGNQIFPSVSLFTREWIEIAYCRRL